jgi:hypothetical protein
MSTEVGFSSQESHDGSFDLSNVKTGFADSFSAADHAKNLGLSNEVSLRACSPALVLDDATKFPLAEGYWSDSAGVSLREGTLQLCRDIYQLMSDDDEFAEAATAVTQIGVLFPSTVRLAMALKTEDFTEKVVVVRTNPEDSDETRAVNIPWDELLKSNPELIVVDAPVEASAKTYSRHRDETVSFVDRQKLGGWQKIGFAIFQKIWDRIPFTSPKGTFLILRENYLLRETALNLVCRGYGISSIKRAPIAGQTIDSDTHHRLTKILRTAVDRFIEERTVPESWPVLREIFELQCSTAFSRFIFAKQYWVKTLDALRVKKPKAILTNMLMTPETASLHTVCRQRNLPVVAFQHGVAREINQYNYFLQAYFEGNTSDYFFAYNPQSAKQSESSAFSKAKAIAVGMPAINLRSGKFRKPRSGAAPILYVSTQLYAVATNMTVSRGSTDVEMANSELALLDNVIRKIPHKVLYKPYPERRFLDPDPVLLRANSLGNVETYLNGDDLGFLVPDFRLIMTSRGTSTLGGCVTSGKPLVFIDYPTQLPLQKEAKVEFESAFFVFDAGKPDYLKELTTFLSRPIDQMEEEWVSKSEARKRVIDKYFSFGGRGAGARAARHLLEELETRGTF